MAVPGGMSVPSEKALSMSDLDIDDLAYRGEGNLSLVVSLKSKTPVDLKSVEEQLLAEIGFSWNVMCKLFEPGIWIDRYLLVALDARQMARISDKVEAQRPDHRKSKSLPAQNYLALLIDDYCDFRGEQLEWLGRDLPAHQLVGSVYSVEIKPKQGFITPECAQLGICKFRLRQQEKLSSRLIEKPSDYCPLDLFSGDQTRMRFALSSLIANPQNNFRLFVDQKPVPDDELDKQFGQSGDLDKEKLINLLISALSHPFELGTSVSSGPASSLIAHSISSVSSSDPHPTPTASSDLQCKYHFNIHQLNSRKPLNEGSILKCILDVQRLDEIGSSKAFELYSSLKAKYATQFAEWLDQSRNSTEILHFSNDPSNEPESWKRQLTNFLYSMTAKDCSVLITFQKVLNVAVPETDPRCAKHANHSRRLCFYADQSDGSVYLFTIALVDLDRKQPEKAQTTHRNDQARIKEFKEFLASQ